MLFNIMLNPVRKHYAVQALCCSSIINIMLHTVHKHYAVQYHTVLNMPFNICNTQTYHAAIHIMLHTASIMLFNIMLHTVRKHYAVQYHAAYSTQALCHVQYHAAYSKHYAVQEAYSMQALFNIVQYHAAYISTLCHSISALCCSISLLHTVKCNAVHYAIQYHAAYSTASIMLFNIMLHTVRKHYAVQYHAAYSTASIMPFNIHAQYASIMLHTASKHYAIQYHAAYSIQYASIMHSISCCIHASPQYHAAISCCIQYCKHYAVQYSCCIQYASIMPFNIMLHTVRKH